MKVILRIFIPLCIFSFIAFGVSVMFLGTHPITSDTTISELVISDSGTNTYDITDSFTSIRADIGAYKLTIKPWSEDRTQIAVSGDNSSRIKTWVSNDRLNIESDWSWSDNWNWLKNILNGSAFSTEVLLRVPDKTYEQVTMYVGAGSLTSDGIQAKDVSLDIGAGSLTYTQPSGFRTDHITANISAGSLVAKNMAAGSYDVDVSAGSANIYGLTGSGSVDVSAGSVKLQYTEFNEDCDIDVSAGDVTLDIPEDSSAKFICDKSAGDIRIMVGDENRHADDGDTISINGGKTVVNLSVSAGSIKVVNSTASAAEGDIISTNDGDTDVDLSVSAVESVTIVNATELTPDTGAESVTTAFEETAAIEA